MTAENRVPVEEKKDPRRLLFPAPPVIESESLCLRPLEAEDARKKQAYLEDHVQPDA